MSIIYLKLKQVSLWYLTTRNAFWNTLTENLVNMYNRRMCCKQSHQRDAMHHYLTRGWYQRVSCCISRAWRVWKNNIGKKRHWRWAMVICTSTDVLDYKMLNRTKSHLREAAEIRLTLQSHNFTRMNWWVDVSFAVHTSMLSHTWVVFHCCMGCLWVTHNAEDKHKKYLMKQEFVWTKQRRHRICMAKNIFWACEPSWHQ